MKIRRKHFDNFIKDRFNPIKIKEDKYVVLVGIPYIIKAIFKFIGSVLMLPIGFLIAILDSILDCIKELPAYFSDLKDDFCDISPIRYIEVIDEELVESIK